MDQYLLKHEFIKRLHRRYNAEGIAIPFPIRTVYVNEPPRIDGARTDARGHTPLTQGD